MRKPPKAKNMAAAMYDAQLIMDKFYNKGQTTFMMNNDIAIVARTSEGRCPIVFGLIMNDGSADTLEGIIKSLERTSEDVSGIF